VSVDKDDGTVIWIPSSGILNTDVVGVVLVVVVVEVFFVEVVGLVVDVVTTGVVAVLW
jgi:hypothetical protein